jgi:hypothetical protein
MSSRQGLCDDHRRRESADERNDSTIQERQEDGKDDESAADSIRYANGAAANGCVHQLH